MNNKIKENKMTKAERIEYLLDELDGDILDLREMIENDDSDVGILTLIKKYMIPTLEEIAKELL